MDFANERYVRLYTRDTVTWKRLQWDGQNCLTQLLRKADRAGVIDLDGIEPWESAVVLCNAPEDAARRGVGKMLELGVVVHDGDRLVFPKFLEANETPMSDAQRARESRAKRAALTPEVTRKSLVTKRDDSASRIVTAPSQDVTGRHAESRGVTRGHAASLLTTPSVPSVLIRSEPVGENARDPEDLESQIRIGFETRFVTATAASPNRLALTKAAGQLAAWVEQTAPLRKISERELVTRMLDGFFANDNARAKRYPVAFLVQNTLEYVDPPPLKTVARANARPRLEMGRVATPEEHAADAANTEWEWPTYSTKP